MKCFISLRLQTFVPSVSPQPSSSCWFIDSTIKQVNCVGAWAPCASLSLVVTHLSLCLTLLSCDFRVWLLSLLPSVRLVVSVFIAFAVLLCAATCVPLSSQFPCFLKLDDSVDGVEPPLALDLHLVLSVSFFQRSCVSRKLSVVVRRLFRPVSALATC